jgi:hypothetical protein
MDSREIYAAIFDPRGPAGLPRGEWQFVGDLRCLDDNRLAAVAENISASRLLIAVSRTLAQEISANELVPYIREFLPHGEVRAADMELKNFLQVSPIGVARYWKQNA